MSLDGGGQLFQAGLEAFDPRQVSIKLPMQPGEFPAFGLKLPMPPGELPAFGLELPDQLTELARLRPVA